jgi:hypothetical protein
LYLAELEETVLPTVEILQVPDQHQVQMEVLQQENQVVVEQDLDLILMDLLLELALLQVVLVQLSVE